MKASSLVDIILQRFAQTIDFLDEDLLNFTGYIGLFEYEKNSYRHHGCQRVGVRLPATGKTQQAQRPMGRALCRDDRQRQRGLENRTVQ